MAIKIKKSRKLICFFYCSLWSDFSVSCFCYVVNRPRPLFAQPWFQFIQPLESQPLWWPSPLLALALLKRPFSHSGTYFCILMFFRKERKKLCTKKKMRVSPLTISWRLVEKKTFFQILKIWPILLEECVFSKDFVAHARYALLIKKAFWLFSLDQIIFSSLLM